jgi:hypothetical protein
MKNSPQDTDDILSAIRDMMNDEEAKNEQSLPKDVLELTESVEQKKEPIEHDNVLELTQLVSDDDSVVNLDNFVNEDSSSTTEENELRATVRESIKNNVSAKIDLIIKEEMKKIIEEKLSSAQVIIDSTDKN